ncbi:MAG: chorismate synthase, partial [Anaerolineae bacterium]
MIGPSPSSGEDSAGLPRPVIVTKVRPPLRRRDLVSRPRLIEYLTDNVDRKLILVSAAAGYGKTTLVVDFIHESGIPACWYSLDEGDSDLTVFLEHLVASLRQRYPGVCEQTLMQLRSNTHPDHEALVGSLINEITEGVDDFFLLVLDDFHKLDDSVLINASLDFLLRYLPDNCRLVVCSRTLPKKLTLTRLAGEGQVLGVGQEHLRFGRGEIRDLVRHLHHEELTDEELEKLAEASEGWIAALVMGSSKLLDGVRTGLDLPTAKSGQLFEYLAQEVMDQLPADVQAFLLQTAILQVLNADVCDAVTGRTDSAAMLEHLEEQNLYLGRIEGEELWYRFHGLFHDFLQARLAEEGLSDELVERHLRAASWYADHEEPESEIHHLLEADRFEEAAVKMVGQLRPAAASGRWRLIVRWVTSLPEEVRREWPDLLASLGVAYSYLGRLPESIAVEGQALQAFQEQGDDKGAALALMHRSYSWRFVGQVDAAMEDSARALELASDPDGYVASSVHRNLGACLSLRGDMVAAASELRLALERASARETAARVAVGAICQQFLSEFGIRVGSYVVQIGSVLVTLPDDGSYPDRFARAEENDVRCPDAVGAEAMQAEIREAMA